MTACTKVLMRNDDFLLKTHDFALKNVGYIIKQVYRRRSVIFCVYWLCRERFADADVIAYHPLRANEKPS